MYHEAKTWNPFKGCDFACSYCVPSFQRQSKRQKSLCEDCYKYAPHCHEGRLKTIPGAKIIFVCGNADISFCPLNLSRKIIRRISEHNKRATYKTYYFQSKQPVYFEPLLMEFPENVILLTTLETNRDDGYDVVSKAPLPSERYKQFKALVYPRKVVTIEPVLDFDLELFDTWIKNIAPEYVWFGFNSKPKSVSLPEPTTLKAQELVDSLTAAGIEVRGKTMRGVKLPP